MKLVNQRKKRLVLIISIIAVLLVVALAVGAIIYFSNTPEPIPENTVTDVQLSSKPYKTVYYVGEQFDPKGLRVQVITHNYDLSYFVDHTKLSWSGFDSSAPTEEQIITVTYRGFSLSFTVEIKEAEKTNPVLERIEVYDFKTIYTLKQWNMSGPNTTGAKLRCFYSDGSVVEDIVLRDMYIPGYERLDAPGITEIIVNYSDGVTSVSTTVTITVTN